MKVMTHERFYYFTTCMNVVCYRQIEIWNLNTFFEKAQSDLVINESYHSL